MRVLPSASPLLEIEELKKYFPLPASFWGKKSGNIRAVDGVSFALTSGKTLGLVGESGCGKSTLGRTILRLYEPSGGRIRFAGRDITTVSRRELQPLRRQMQIIFQDPYSSLNPRMTVSEILSEPLIIHQVGTAKERAQRVDQLLERVGLSAQMRGRYPHEFSGGQKQRLGIARALALSPQLLICDEPVSALDVSIQAQILNLLKDLQAELGLAYLFISHNLAVIEHSSDEVAVMYLGRIVEQAPREALFAAPQHPYTKALIAAIPLPQVAKPGSPSRQRQVLAGDVPNPAAPPQGCHFHPRCPLASERCRREAPLLRSVDGASHLAACHNISCTLSSDLRYNH